MIFRVMKPRKSINCLESSVQANTFERDGEEAADLLQGLPTEASGDGGNQSRKQ